VARQVAEDSQAVVDSREAVARPLHLAAP